MDKALHPLNNWGLASKINTRFQTSLDQNANKKFLKIPFKFAHFPFFPNHLELKQQIHTFFPVVPSETIPARFQTKMGKLYTSFQTKTAQKPYPSGRHIPIWFIWGSNPPSLSPTGRSCKLMKFKVIWFLACCAKGTVEQVAWGGGKEGGGGGYWLLQ